MVTIPSANNNVRYSIYIYILLHDWEGNEGKYSCTDIHVFNHTWHPQEVRRHVWHPRNKTKMGKRMEEER